MATLGAADKYGKADITNYLPYLELLMALYPKLLSK